MNHKISWELPVGRHVQLYSETGSVCHFFWREVMGGDGGRRKASNYNCNFFPVSNLSVSNLSGRLAAERAGVGRGGVGTRTMGIHAIGAQSCVTTVPERSHVMVW